MEPSEQSASQRSQIHRIEIDIDWPPGNVVVSLLDGTEPVLVDAGLPGENARQSVIEGLATANRSVEEIEHLLITHPHYDHLGQIPFLAATADPTVYAPLGVRQRLNQDPAELEQTVRRNGQNAGLLGTALDRAVEKSLASLERDRSLFDPDIVDHWLEDDQQCTIGNWEFRGMHTPGHQADHFCYYSADERVLFSGDLLLEPFRSIVINAGLDVGVDDGVPDFYASLDRLSALPVDQIFPGHGPAHDDLDGTIDRSRRSLDRLLVDTQNRLTEGPKTALEIASVRAENWDIHYVLPETVSVLQYLTAQGKITRTVEDGVYLYQQL